MVELGHTHVCLQEEEEDGSIEEMIASVYDCKEDDLCEIVCDCRESNHWKPATALTGLD